jgi:hypothetical protein
MDIVRRASDAENNYNLLLAGRLLVQRQLLGISENKKGVHFDGRNTTNRILDVLQEKTPKITHTKE